MFKTHQETIDIKNAETTMRESSKSSCEYKVAKDRKKAIYKNIRARNFMPIITAVICFITLIISIVSLIK